MNLPPQAQALVALAAEYARPGPADERPQPPYRVDEAVMEELRGAFGKHLDQMPEPGSDRSSRIELMLFSGRWCGDCRKEVPRLLKVLSETLFGKGELAASDRIILHLLKVPIDREIPTTSIKINEVTRLPTLVVISQGLELGRIVERPEPSWEEALLEILAS